MYVNVLEKSLEQHSVLLFYPRCHWGIIEEPVHIIEMLQIQLRTVGGGLRDCFQALPLRECVVCLFVLNFRSKLVAFTVLQLVFEKSMVLMEIMALLGVWVYFVF